MKSFKNIEIEFTDNNDNVVDFNGIPFTLIIIVEFIQDKSELFDSTHTTIESKANPLNNEEETNLNLYKMMVSKAKN